MRFTYFDEVHTYTEEEWNRLIAVLEAHKRKREKVIHIYRNPETSEVINDEEFTRLVDALCTDPTEDAAIAERGVTYATGFAFGSKTAWTITKAGVQRLVFESLMPRRPQLENPTVWEKVDQ